jgi:predicted kinase
MRVEQRNPRSAATIVSWRRRQLLDSGFAPPLARRLARDRAYDLHALIELVERGCPPSLAVRILAPLDERERF